MDTNYRSRIHSYILARSFYEQLLTDALITKVEFNRINAKLLAKYNVSIRSIFND